MANKFVELDTGSSLEITAENDATGAAIDLTGFLSVQLRYKVDCSELQVKAMSIDADPTTGKASYKFLAGELLSGGLFTGEVRLTDGSGFVLTSLENIEETVKERLVA